MQISALTPTLTLPRLVTADPGEDIIALARNERARLRDLAREHGALLFRGFDVREPEHFSAFCSGLSDELLDYTERSTPRRHVEGKVYTSTEYPPDAHIPLHCEMAYTRRWPRWVWFYSHIAAEEGGETPICDARKILRGDLPGDAREVRVARRGDVRAQLPARYRFALAGGLRRGNARRARGLLQRARHPSRVAERGRAAYACHRAGDGASPTNR
ncbi:MAG: TauD/TfdA family dioxygenase [Polyangiaceae bacterium]